MKTKTKTKTKTKSKVGQGLNHREALRRDCERAWEIVNNNAITPGPSLVEPQAEIIRLDQRVAQLQSGNVMLREAGLMILRGAGQLLSYRE